jgi:hypothetical protein
MGSESETRINWGDIPDMEDDIKKFIQLKWDSTNIERFPGPQPVSIEKKHLPLLAQNRYMVCEKTDGVRHFLVCFTDSCNRKICAVVNRSFDYTLYPLTIPRDTLLDGELIDDEFIIHDAVCIQGEDLREKSLIERLKKAEALTKIIIPSKIRVRCKHMYHYKDMSKLVLGDKTDGVIFTPIDEPVRMGTHRSLFKWKPLEKITIDFLIKSGNFCIQHESKLLAVQKDQELKEEGIFECEFSGDKWILIKRRTDKSHPNNKRTYERTLVNIKENIQFCDLVPK